MASKYSTELTIDQKKSIASSALRNPTWTMEEVRADFQSKHRVRPSDHQMHRIIRHASNFHSLATCKRTGCRRRRRAPVHADIEERLAAWVTDVNARAGRVSYRTIQETARRMGSEVGVSESHFKFSWGWVQRFVARHGLVYRMVSGESKASDDVAASKAREALATYIQLKQTPPHLIYNFDETAAFYRQLPLRTMSAVAVAGGKVAKDRCTVGLAVNSDGSHKLAPIVIGKALRPQ
jgi:hypothetical protein